MQCFKSFETDENKDEKMYIGIDEQNVINITREMTSIKNGWHTYKA